MIEREITETLKSLVSDKPFVMVLGPRGSGKTTLCRESFPELAYANLELSEQREFANQDPIGFLASLGNRAIIDEIQRVPSLVPFLYAHKEEATQPSRFVLTSSESVDINTVMNDSAPLIGHTASVCLLPFTLAEREQAGVSDGLNDVLFSGFYPRIHELAKLPREVLADQFGTLVERDVPRIGGVRDSSRFELFTRLCAGRIGRTMDLVALGRDAGVSHTTARNWIEALEAGYAAFRLPAIQSTTRKRSVKSPKLYFYDVGLAAYLMGIESSEQITTHPLRSALFENMVVVEAMKYRFNKGKPSNLTFFRDNHGLECQLLFEFQSTQIAIEINSSATISSDAFDSLNAIEQALPEVESKFLVYGGTDLQSQSDVEIVPFDGVSDIFESLEIGRESESVDETNGGAPISSLDAKRLNDAYEHWIHPLIQSLASSMAEFQEIFGTISQLEFVEYGQNQAISPTLFSREAWESTKQDHLMISLDELTELDPLTLAHQTRLTDFSSVVLGDLAIEVRLAWTFSDHGLKRIVSIDGEAMSHLESDVVPYENLDSISSAVDHLCAEVIVEIKSRIERHTDKAS